MDMIFLRGGSACFLINYGNYEWVCDFSTGRRCVCVLIK